MSAIGQLFPTSLFLSFSLLSFSFFNFPDVVNFSFLKILLYISKAVKLYPIFYEESVDHLLIFCPLAHSMWMHMIQLFGIDWVMPGLVADLLCCWHHWLGKNNSFIWNMWTIWTECNQRSFEDIEKSMAQLLDLCQRTQCWGLSNCSTIIDFLLFLRIGF